MSFDSVEITIGKWTFGPQYLETFETKGLLRLHRKLNPHNEKRVKTLSVSAHLRNTGIWHIWPDNLYPPYFTNDVTANTCREALAIMKAMLSNLLLLVKCGVLNPHFLKYVCPVCGQLLRHRFKRSSKCKHVLHNRYSDDEREARQKLISRCLKGGC